MIWNSLLIFRLFPNPFEEVSELQIFVNICPNICQYLPIFVLLYEVLYLHLQYTLSLLTSRDLTLPFYGTFVTINILQKNCCYLSRLSKTFLCTGCPPAVPLYDESVQLALFVIEYFHKMVVHTWCIPDWSVYRIYGIFEIIWNIQNTCMIVKERLWTGGVYLAGAVIRL